MKCYTPTLIGLTLLVNTSCMEQIDEESRSSHPTKKAERVVINPVMTVEVATIFSDTLGWGYEIFVNQERVIRQTHIPAINGIKGFRTKNDAEKVGNLVADKIRNNNNPPSVSMDELDSLTIWY